MAHSQPVTYDNDFFLKNIVQESYADIRDTPKLATYVTQLVARAGHPLDQPIALERLAGVAPNALQLAGDSEVLSAADLVVRVAETNMEVVLADFSGGADLHVPMGADAILRHKLLRSGSTAAALDGFARLLELNGIPDIRVAVESGAISLPEIWKLRQRRVARRFREWLADAAPSRDVERLYVESLGRTSLVQSLPARVVRFALTICGGRREPSGRRGCGCYRQFLRRQVLSRLSTETDAG